MSGISERLKRIEEDTYWLGAWMRANRGNDACNHIVDQVLMCACTVYGINIAPYIAGCKKEEDCERVLRDVMGHFEEIGRHTVMTVAGTMFEGAGEAAP